MDDNPDAAAPVLAMPLAQDTSASVLQNDAMAGDAVLRPRLDPVERAAIRTAAPRAGPASAPSSSDQPVAGPKRVKLERHGDGADPQRAADRLGLRDDDSQSNPSEPALRHALVLPFNPLDAILAPLDEDDQDELRQTARSALLMAKDSLIWLRPTLLGGGFASTLGDMPAGFGFQHGAEMLSHNPFGRTVSSRDEGARAGGSAAASEYPGSRDGGGARLSRATVDPSEVDSLREIIRTLRTVLNHPMSWFVLSLLAVATMAVSTARRWLR